MDPISLVISGACSGLCCLSATALAVGGAILFLRRKPAEIEDDSSAPVAETPIGSAGSTSGASGDAAPRSQPRPIPSMPAAPEGAKPGLAVGGAFDGDLFDDEEMATVVAPPPPGLMKEKEVPSAPAPPPPKADAPPAPPADEKPRGTPAPPPPRSSGQTIIAFDDDDEDW